MTEATTTVWWMDSMDEPDAVTAHEAREMARAAIKRIWKRRLGKPLFPDFYAFEDQAIYAFGYTTSQWHGSGARYEHPGAFVPVVNKRPGALHLEPSGPEFFRRHPDLTRIPDSKILGPMTWRMGPAERLGLAGKQITPTKDCRSPGPSWSGSGSGSGVT